MSILVSEILSDFNAEIINYIPDPTSIANARKIRLIDKCQRYFAADGLAFDEHIYINVKEDVDTYTLPDTFLALYAVEYDETRIIRLPRGAPVPTTVKYYETYDNKIVLIIAPDEDGDAYLKVFYYRLPAITTQHTTDEVELANKHPEYQDAIVDYLLYEILKSKPELAQISIHHWQKYSDAILKCKSKQRKKNMHSIMHIGL